MTRTMKTISALLLTGMLASTGTASAIPHVTTQLVVCPDRGRPMQGALVLARRPAAVIYEVRADHARSFALRCSGSSTWEPRTPTRFG